MIFVSRILRIGLVATCLFVLSGIIPISLTHFHTGNACPTLGPLPLCYVVSASYTIMLIATSFWHRVLMKLFLCGAIPVIILAVLGTGFELAGRPTCPRPESGLPLCYVSLVLGLGLLVAFVIISRLERKQRTAYL